AVHPHDHKSIYVIPLQGDGRFMPEGKAAVWRSRDGGDTWTRQDRGLPQEGAFCGVLREGMAVDTLAVPGIYFGTNTGEVWGSPDEGDTWSLVAGYLPPVLSVETAVVDA
ncbi:MAG TPA: exo-alpha-sialidase, partial [Chloroflexota bacterium]|nr:exo-alpha-sialidase [Chloroflexota bacterium]